MKPPIAAIPATVGELTAAHIGQRITVDLSDDPYYDEGDSDCEPRLSRTGTLHAINHIGIDTDAGPDAEVHVLLVFQDVPSLWDIPTTTPCAAPQPRTTTPPRKLPDGSTRHTVQRACNGCYETIGDVTDDEMQRAIAGLPMLDVRDECPRCSPSTPDAEEIQ